MHRELKNLKEEGIIDNLYSPEGFYIAFVAGWLPVPDLWNDSDEFAYAKNYESKTVHGECRLFKDKKIILLYRHSFAI